MASGTITGTTSNEYIEAKVEWESTAIPENNQSKVVAKLYYRRTNTGYTTYGNGSFSVKVGTTKSTTSKYVEIGTSWVFIVQHTAYVAHEDDGTKKVAISATGSIPDTTLTSTTLSKTVSLGTIPRAADVSASDVNIGSKCKVTWTPHAKSHSFVLKLSMGGWSESKTIEPSTTSSYTYTGYTIPYTAAAEIPSAKTGKMTAELQTYSAGKLIGSSSDTFTVTVPSNSSTQPAVTMSLAPVSSLASPLNSLYIQGYSRVKATLSAEGKEKASISSLTMTVQGKTYASPYQSDLLTATGNVTVTGKAKDSREIEGEATQTVYVIPYSAPQILPASDESDIICERCDSNGNLTASGTCLKIKARRSYSEVVSDGTQYNKCTIRFRYRLETSNSFSGWTTLLSGSTTSTDTVSTTITSITFDPQKAYVIQVGVADTIGKTDAAQFGVPTDNATLHLAKGGKRIGLLRYAEDSDEAGIDVGAPIHGGSVDNLTLGEVINASSSSRIDLNNYKDAGNYYSPSADVSQYITHTPYTGGGFGLIVREIQSANMIRQEMYYGRTNWQRHYNSSTGEWSDWLRYLMTNYAETTAVDFVSEIGVWNVDNSDADKGYWRYRKWKSGAVDMNGLIQVFPTTEGTLGAAGVYYSAVIYIDLPFEVVNFNFTGSTNSYHCFVGNCNSVDGNAKQIRLRLYRFTDFAGLADYKVYVRIVASGKLKS